MSAKDAQYQQQLTLIRALLHASSWNQKIESLELIETHISWVILCNDVAYKFKKAVDLGFLDFTTLEKRKHYCEEELRLNSRLAPDIYLKVVPVYGTHEAPLFEERGVAIEYAVMMRRFPQENLLIRMLDSGRVTPALIDKIAETSASFHQQIPTAAEDSPYGSPEQIWEPLQENLTQISACISETSGKAILQQVEQWCQQELQRRREMFRQRKRDGFIRECHGDMHLGNMVLYQGRLRIFDGIEFNPNLRWIDVISEIAFCCMDLDDHQHREFGFRLLNHYMAHTGDYEGLGVMRYYLVYRALVRAKVACIRLLQEREQEREKEAHACSTDEGLDFSAYFTLACRYTHPEKTALFITHGFSGSGKSTITLPLAIEMHAIHIRSDRERQRLYPQCHATATGIDKGIYSSEATHNTYTRLATLAGAVLDAGYSVIIDATFLKHEQRQRFQQLAQQLATPLLILDFIATPEALRYRIRERELRNQDISEADLEVLEYQLNHHDPLTQKEEQYTIEVDTEERASLEQLKTKIQQIIMATEKNGTKISRE